MHQTRLALFAILLLGCQMTEHSDEIIVQGHRGCRGLLPENTIEAFEHAARLGVSTLELDVVLTADYEVLVSHEPFMSAEICLTPHAGLIVESEQMQHNIFRMTADSAQRYDCGSKGNPRFSEQRPVVGAYKPLMRDVVERMRAFCAQEQLDIPFFNIEIKSRPEWVGDFHPSPKEYVRIFLGQFNQLDISDRTTIQSFDPNILNELFEQAPGLRMVYLSEDSQKTHIEKLAELNLKPYGYSAYFKMASPELVTYCRDNNIHLSVWTVNDIAEMEMLLSMGVNDIITDYPDRLLSLAQARNLKVKRSGHRAQ